MFINEGEKLNKMSDIKYSRNITFSKRKKNEKYLKLLMIKLLMELPWRPKVGL